eukprot:Rhum_TRINITY_DN13050_c2_g1::Rhum_TRINITY_DN13050_c2_g1_i1::g.56591::m.56591
MDGVTTASMAMILGGAPPPASPPPQRRPVPHTTTTAGSPPTMPPAPAPQRSTAGVRRLPGRDDGPSPPPPPAHGAAPASPRSRHHRSEQPQPSAAAAAPASQITGVRMDLPYAVHARGSIAEAALRRACDDVFDVAYAAFSPEKYNPHSEVAALNALAQGAEAAVSQEMWAVLSAVDCLHRLTDGAFDPAAAETVLHGDEWEDAQQTPQEKAATTASCTWPELFALQRTEEGCVGGGGSVGSRRSSGGVAGTVRKLLGRARLDVSGVAKGWTVDALHAALVARADVSGDGVYVEWAGEVRCSGCHPDGRPWRVGVADPRAPPLPGAAAAAGSGRVVAAFAGGGGGGGGGGVPPHPSAFATSGDYAAEVSGRPGYTPILNPRTGVPLRRDGASGLASVTVGTAGSCAYADALATALMCAGSPEGVRRAATAYTTRLRAEVRGDGGGSEGSFEQDPRRIVRLCAQDGRGRVLLLAASASASAATTSDVPSEFVEIQSEESGGGGDGGGGSPGAAVGRVRDVVRAMPHQVFVLRWYSAATQKVLSVQADSLAFLSQKRFVFGVQRGSPLSLLAKQPPGSKVAVLPVTPSPEHVLLLETLQTAPLTDVLVDRRLRWTTCLQAQVDGVEPVGDHYILRCTVAQTQRRAAPAAEKTVGVLDNGGDEGSGGGGGGGGGGGSGSGVKGVLATASLGKGRRFYLDVTSEDVRVASCCLMSCVEGAGSGGRWASAWSLTQLAAVDGGVGGTRSEVVQFTLRARACEVGDVVDIVPLRLEDYETVAVRRTALPPPQLPPGRPSTGLLRCRVRSVEAVDAAYYVTATAVRVTVPENPQTTSYLIMEHTSHAPCYLEVVPRMRSALAEAGQEGRGSPVHALRGRRHLRHSQSETPPCPAQDAQA